MEETKTCTTCSHPEHEGKCASCECDKSATPATEAPATEAPQQ